MDEPLISITHYGSIKLVQPNIEDSQPKFNLPRRLVLAYQKPYFHLRNLCHKYREKLVEAF